MNMNEVISNFPVGEPKEITFGFGSNFGIHVLKNSNPNKRQEYLVEWLKLIERSSDRMLSLLGYQRDQDTNNVVVKANGRRITTLDSEHYFCVAGFTLPQRKSGGKGGSPVILDYHKNICIQLKKLTSSLMDAAAKLQPKLLRVMKIP